MVFIVMEAERIISWCLFLRSEKHLPAPQPAGTSFTIGNTAVCGAPAFEEFRMHKSHSVVGKVRASTVRTVEVWQVLQPLQVEPLVLLSPALGPPSVVCSFVVHKVDDGCQALLPIHHQLHCPRVLVAILVLKRLNLFIDYDLTADPTRRGLIQATVKMSDMYSGCTLAVGSRALHWTGLDVCHTSGRGLFSRSVSITVDAWVCDHT